MNDPDDDCTSLTSETIFVLGSLEADSLGNISAHLTVDITIELLARSSCATRPCADYSEGGRTCVSGAAGCGCTVSSVYDDPQNAEVICATVESGDYCVQGDRLFVAERAREV